MKYNILHLLKWLLSPLVIPAFVLMIFEMFILWMAEILEFKVYKEPFFSIILNLWEQIDS